MSLITRNNYEAFMLDYVEEKLSTELIAELMLFLEINPDLKEELDEFELHELVPLETTLEDKANLKKENKSVTLDNYEELIIAEIEGKNTIETSKELHSFLSKNPDKQVDLIAYKRTKLVAPAIIFDNKKSLKKKEGKVIPMYWWYTSAAAVVIILFLLNVFTNSEQEKLPIANKEEIVSPEIDNKEEIIPEELLVKENKVAVVNEKNSSQYKYPKQIIKKSPNNIVPEEIKDEQIALADKIEKVILPKEDSIPVEIIKEIPVEEIQYADNVKITYEDELAANTSDSKDEYKTVGQIISQPFKKRFTAIFGSPKTSN